MRGKQEVELRVLITNKQLRNLLNKLKELHAKDLGKEEMSDAYFCHKSVKSFSGVEMNDVGSYGLRLRKIGDKKNNEKVELNIKVISKKGDHHSWKEHEIEVSNFNESKHILTVLGYKEFFSLQKVRRSYKVKDLKILIDDIKNFQPILEIEKITSQSQGEKAKEEIMEFLESCGITSSDVVPKSVTNILMKKWSKF